MKRIFPVGHTSPVCFIPPMSNSQDSRREFPWEFKAKKPILIYPEGAVPADGDVLEIGPGRGDLLMKLAEDLPEQRFVAIEIGKKRHYRLIKRIEKRNLHNIQLICGDARIALPRYFTSPTFRGVYLLFPDPWPKRRHEYHRLFREAFVRLLVSVMLPGADLYFATDVQWYAEWGLANVAHIDELENVGNPYVTGEAFFGYEPTFFEQKWRAEGRAIYYMHFRKRA